MDTKYDSFDSLFAANPCGSNPNRGECNQDCWLILCLAQERRTPGFDKSQVQVMQVVSCARKHNVAWLDWLTNTFGSKTLRFQCLDSHMQLNLSYHTVPIVNGIVYDRLTNSKLSLAQYLSEIVPQPTWSTQSWVRLFDYKSFDAYCRNVDRALDSQIPYTTTRYTREELLAKQAKS